MLGTYSEENNSTPHELAKLKSPNVVDNGATDHSIRTSSISQEIRHTVTCMYEIATLLEIDGNEEKQ